MTDKEISPSKQSAVERLNQQCLNLRDRLTDSQNQKNQVQKLNKKQETELKVYETKLQALEGQLAKQKIENHKFIEAYEKQKKQRLTLATNQQTVLNDLNRDSVQLGKLTNENKQLKEQVESLQKALDTEKTQRVAALREKQNNNNKIKLLQTKLQAATMQAKFSKGSGVELELQNKRLRQLVQSLQKKVAERQGPLQVQTIYKDSNSSTQKLVQQFKDKLNQKEKETIRQMQSYEQRNIALVKRIAQLESELSQKK